jgi:SRSO17 transposase
MTPAQMKILDRELTEFLDYITSGMGRPERRRAMEMYLTGLLLDGERKTAVSMSKRLVEDEMEAEAMRQRLQQCVTISTWADEEVRKRLALRFEEQVRPEVFIIDDTGFAKKGEYSVGVARQYSGTLGRTDNCQVATSLHVATDTASGCIGMQLYLPEKWASDVPRRRRAGVPDDVVFKRKWEIAIDLLSDAIGWGLSPRLVLADSGYGDCADFREAIVETGCSYLVGISAAQLSWPPGSKPRSPTKTGRPGRPRSRHQDGDKAPLAIGEIGRALRYRRYSVPNGVGGVKTGHFAFTRVHLANGHTRGRPPSEEVWLVCEWRPTNDEYKFYVSNLPPSTPRKELVRLTKLRYRIERDYQDMKGLVGLDDFEGRTWRGFHHHATLCAVAHGFLALQRQLSPPISRSLDGADGEETLAAPPPDQDRDVPTVPATL